MKFLNASFFLVLFLSFPSFGQELPRRADFQAQISWPDNKVPGAIIREVSAKTPLEEAGLKANDVIISVNGRKVFDQEDWSATIYGIRANQPTYLEVKRGQIYLSKRVELNPLPKENHANVDTYYEAISSDFGIKQRVIITKPKENKKYPAIVLIQGLSCSTIEENSSRSNNWVKLINNLAEKSNMILMRIDKPGVGDSEGDCGKTDFLTELNGYESAVKLLKTKPYVDTSKIIVYGNSMGSALAPYLANKFNLAGVISDGTFYKSWYEHMLEIERRILRIEGKSEAEIYSLMNEVFIPLYYEMLVKKRSFEEILAANPGYKKYHRQGLNHMYGRSMEYYHQVQDFNFAKNWEAIKVPVRVRWGTNDWIMTENDNDMIMDVLNAKDHKNHQLYKYKDLDHWSTLHLDYSSSYHFKPGAWEDKISQQIIDWAWEIIAE